MPYITPSTAANFITATVEENQRQAVDCAMRVLLPSGKIAIHHSMTLSGISGEVLDGWPVLGFAIYSNRRLLGAVGDFPAQAQLSLSV